PSLTRPVSSISEHRLYRFLIHNISHGEMCSCDIVMSRMYTFLCRTTNNEARIECDRACAPSLPRCSNLIQSTLFEAHASSPTGKEAIPSDQDLISILEGNNAGERRGCRRFCYSKAIQKGVCA